MSQGNTQKGESVRNGELLIVAVLVVLGLLLYKTASDVVSAVNRSTHATHAMHTTLLEIKVDAELHQERQEYHWERHPGDNVIPGPGWQRPGSPIGATAPDEDEPQPTLAEEFREQFEEKEDE